MERVFLLDKSGSMQSRVADTIGGFNTLVSEQMNEGGTMSLYTFSDKLTCEYTGVPIKDVKPMTAEDYKPSGNTALYDAMGDILNKHDTGTFVVMTDGEENASRKYTKAHVKDLIARSKLTIIYAGADIEDAVELGVHSVHHYDGHRTPEMFRLLSQEISNV
jgi:hypothetical protein